MTHFKVKNDLYNRKRRLIQALLFCAFCASTATEAHAICLNASSNERLINYCLVQRTSNQLATLRTAQIIDYRLKHEGYTRGLGLPGTVESFSFQPYITPILAYETDVNGGNPDKPLKLGDITFTGDPSLVRKDGVIVGAGAGAYGRYLMGDGRYIDYGAGISYAHSFEHNIGIERRFASVCSKNHIKNWWYIDGCASSSHVEKELTEDTRNALSLTASKLFTSSKNNHHQASFSVNRIYDDNYEGKQLSITLGFNTIHRNGWQTSINATLGESIDSESVDSEMAVREAVSASLALPVRNRRFTLSASYREADGVKLLGIERVEETWTISASYNIYRNIDLSVSYFDTNSTIDYFDESSPTFSLNFEPIRF